MVIIGVDVIDGYSVPLVHTINQEVVDFLSQKIKIHFFLANGGTRTQDPRLGSQLYRPLHRYSSACGRCCVFCFGPSQPAWS